jgi:hypothetical protein
MLTFTDGRPRFGRRAFLRAGALSLGGLSLPGLLAQAATEPKRLRSFRSVIFLFLHGGPSQFKTFDPRMSAPADIRSTTGEIATSIPGVGVQTHWLTSLPHCQDSFGNHYHARDIRRPNYEPQAQKWATSGWQFDGPSRGIARRPNAISATVGGFFRELAHDAKSEQRGPASCPLAIARDEGGDDSGQNFPFQLRAF